MKFTEHEMTSALTAVAKLSVAVRARSDDPDATWESVSRIDRYHLLAGLGDVVLPILVALPDVTIEPGTRAEYDMETIAAAVNETLESKALTAAAKTGAPPADIDPQTTIAHTLVTAEVLNHMPVRLDPDGLLTEDAIEDAASDFVVPDTLEGL
jgi:hypothetical protein